MNLDLLERAFQSHFPAKAENDRAEVCYVEATARDGGGYGVVFRLIIWDVQGETMSIRDVKEQEIYLDLPGLDLATLGRMHELNAALVRVLAKALTHAEVDTLMPHDLVNFSVLKLAKVQTENDFVKALSAPSRLGRYLA
jgi:hypothetical protein